MKQLNAFDGQSYKALKMTDIIAGMEGIALIPLHCRAGIIRYIEEHIPPGSFLTAVLSNDLIRAVRAADAANYAALRDYVRFLTFHAPGDCWGSPEKFKAWVALRGRDRIGRFSGGRAL